MSNIDLDKFSKEAAISQVCNSQNLRLDIADNMIAYGGSFVKALGECLIRADRVNRYKLVETFFDYVKAYQPKHWRKK